MGGAGDLLGVIGLDVDVGGACQEGDNEANTDWEKSSSFKLEDNLFVSLGRMGTFTPFVSGTAETGLGGRVSIEARLLAGDGAGGVGCGD